MTDVEKGRVRLAEVERKDLTETSGSYEVGREEKGSQEGCCTKFLEIMCWILIILTFPISLCFCFRVLDEYQRAVIFRLGRIRSRSGKKSEEMPGAVGPGMVFVIPCLDEVNVVDVRTSSMDINPQQVLSKDQVTLSVDAVVYYRIFSPVRTVCKVANYRASTYLLASTTLRNVLATKTLSEILTEKKAIATDMLMMLDKATDPWGVKVERVEIKDCRLPNSLQRAMAAEAEAEREANAKIVAAEGEQKAATALKEASKIIAESPSALQLRYLQTLNKISAEQNSTIIFPVPMEMFPAAKKE